MSGWPSAKTTPENLSCIACLDVPVQSIFSSPLTSYFQMESTAVPVSLRVKAF